MQKKVDIMTYRMMYSESKNIYISIMEIFAQQVVCARVSE